MKKQKNTQQVSGVASKSPAIPKKKQQNKNTASSGNSLWFMLLTALLVLAAIGVNILYKDMALLYRVLVIMALIVAAVFSFGQTILGKSAIQLARGTQFELRKVTWPTRNETLQSAGMVFVFVLIIGLLLWLIDTIFVALINLILG